MRPRVARVRERMARGSSRLWPWRPLEPRLERRRLWLGYGAGVGIGARIWIGLSLRPGLLSARLRLLRLQPTVRGDAVLVLLLQPGRLLPLRDAVQHRLADGPGELKA